MTGDREADGKRNQTEHLIYVFDGVLKTFCPFFPPCSLSLHSKILQAKRDKVIIYNSIHTQIKTSMFYSIYIYIN